MKIYLDDERQTPAGWTRVYWPAEAIELLKAGRVVEISLDHDLGDDDRGTGYDVVLWIRRASCLGWLRAAGDEGSFGQRVRSLQDGEWDPSNRGNGETTRSKSRSPTNF